METLACQAFELQSNIAPLGHFSVLMVFIPTETDLRRWRHNKHQLPENAGSHRVLIAIAESRRYIATRSDPRVASFDLWDLKLRTDELTYRVSATTRDPATIVQLEKSVMSVSMTAYLGMIPVF